MTILTACLALFLAAIHLWVSRFRILATLPRNIWLSVAGGVAVAYVFLHILPNLAAHQQTLADGLSLAPKTADALLFSVGLAGLTAFYGLEQVAHGPGHPDDPGRPRAGTFWIHIGAFALYNLLIGYLLVHPEDPGPAAVLMFSLAMALHFLSIDVDLRGHHKERYDHTARWLLAGALLLGWLIGTVTDLPETAVALLFAFLAGGVILNALKEELPEDRKSSFASFLAGAVGYSGLLIATTLL